MVNDGKCVTSAELLPISLTGGTGCILLNVEYRILIPESFIRYGSPGCILIDITTRFFP